MKFNCPNCGQKLGVGTIHSGQVVPCPGCGEQVAIPTAEELLKQDTPTSYQVDFSDPDSLPPEKKAQLTKVKQTIQSQIDRGSITISQFMADQDLEGGVDLQGSDTSSASDILTSEQGRKYKIGEVVTAGGMGAILDAKDANIRRNVAMKVMLDPKQASKEDILRFIQEAQVTGQLEHPSIVPVHELGVDGSGSVFYTMKFIHGVTLKEILGKIKENDQTTIKEYPLVRLLNIFQRVCDAIAFAHSKLVIHRDLKPENIMIGEYGEVQVMDWGIAKVLARKGEGASVESRGEEKEAVSAVSAPTGEIES
ncbi:serine/threonine-protein kinase, partial [Verrucomicrobiota bacterium]